MEFKWTDAETALTRIERGLPNVLPISIQIQGCAAVVLFDTGAACSAVRQSVAKAAGLRSLLSESKPEEADWDGFRLKNRRRKPCGSAR